MAKEIERKFLVKNTSFKELCKGVLYRQGYISSNFGTTVRVRTVGNLGFLTVKGTKNGISRDEYEYPIPIEDAEEMLEKICIKPIIVKTRYKYEYKGFCWEIDEFHSDNEGLIIAEIELEYDNQEFEKPEWIGEEVTFNRKYSNSNLIRNPYTRWK